MLYYRKLFQHVRSHSTSFDEAFDRFRIMVPTEITKPEILEKVVDQGKNQGLSKIFIERIFKAIHQESIAHQEKIING